MSVLKYNRTGLTPPALDRYLVDGRHIWHVLPTPSVLERRPLRLPLGELRPQRSWPSGAVGAAMLFWSICAPRLWPAKPAPRSPACSAMQCKPPQGCSMMCAYHCTLHLVCDARCRSHGTGSEWLGESGRGMTPPALIGGAKRGARSASRAAACIGVSHVHR